jgi:hypothetical protein
VSALTAIDTVNAAIAARTTRKERCMACSKMWYGIYEFEKGWIACMSLILYPPFNYL